mmetsp:Transcript_40375/g.29749  ORF Transcript_40375/g.29749 Transcript_40375/m.29749 type:complete len:97 (+) Transcript_40375:171-461(+)
MLLKWRISDLFYFIKWSCTALLYPLSFCQFESLNKLFNLFVKTLGYFPSFLRPNELLIVEAKQFVVAVLHNAVRIFTTTGFVIGYASFNSNLSNCF